MLACGVGLACSNAGDTAHVPGSTPGARVASSAAESEPTTTTAARRSRIDQGPWFSLGVDGFTAGRIATIDCCRSYPAPGVPTTAAWEAATGAQDGLLLMIADPSPSANEQYAYPHRYFRPQPDGSLWSFDAYGLDDTRRQELADAVSLDPIEGFVLPDPTMRPVGQGPLDVGAIRTQVYEGAGGRVTLSVGDYRGQLQPFAEATQVLPIAVADRDGYVATMPGGAVHIAWPAGDGKWAVLDVPEQFASRVEQLADSIEASEFPEPEPESASGATTGVDQLYRGVVSVIETTSHGPMIASSLDESYPPQGGDVPLTGWNWDDVADETTAAGTTWGGPWEVTGTWDGITFTLVGSPIPSPDPAAAPLSKLTAGCDQAALQLVADRIAQLDRAEIGWLSANADVWDGRCAVAGRALFDSAALQAAVAQFGDDVVTLEVVFRPLT